MRILSFGSMNIDHSYIVARIARPGETVAAADYAVRCGGKGFNQSLALSLAGAEVYHAGCVGKDGAFLIDRLNKAGVNTDNVYVSPEQATGHAIIQVEAESGQNCIVIYHGANWVITGKMISDTIRRFDAGDCIVLQNEINSVGEIMQTAHERGLITVLNPSPVTDEICSGRVKRNTDWLVLNEEEGLALSGSHNPEEICRQLHETYCGSKIVLTLGKDGSICYDGSKFIAQPAFRSTVVDTTGAGDTFTGFFIAGISQSIDAATAIRRASAAAAVSIGRPGASESIPTASEVDAFLTNACELQQQ